MLTNPRCVRTLNEVGVDVFALVDLADFIFEQKDHLDFAAFMDAAVLHKHGGILHAAGKLKALCFCEQYPPTAGSSAAQREQHRHSQGRDLTGLSSTGRRGRCLRTASDLAVSLITARLQIITARVARSCKIISMNHRVSRQNSSLLAVEDIVDLQKLIVNHFKMTEDMIAELAGKGNQGPPMLA